MYMRFNYLGVIKSYLLDFKDENGVSRKKVFACALKRNYNVMKNVCNYCGGKQQLICKPGFCLKRNNISLKTIRNIFYF